LAHVLGHFQATNCLFRTDQTEAFLVIFLSMPEQSQADILKNKFWNDLQEISKSLCEKHCLRYNPNVESPINRWISYVLRLIEPKKRSTEFSKGFWERIPTVCISAVLLLKDKFEYGENVNPYQSRTIKQNNLSEKRGRRTDLLWADWNIHHFHLTKSATLEEDGFYPRSDYLLFAIVRNDCTYFLDVKHHKKEDCFSDPDFIQQIVKSWPEIAEFNRIEGITPGKELDAKKIATYRKMGISVPMSLNGNVYEMGLGLSAAATPMDDVFFHDILVFEIESLADELVTYCNRKRFQITPTTFSLIKKKDGLNLACSIDGSYQNIRLHDLEQTNRFFNQLWLLRPT
jgi:hypothetical protein